MTIRNAVPRFGMRTAVALAVVAMAALAALLAVGSPASAQSADDGEEIWSATMTVGANGSFRGFYNLVGTVSDYGSLSILPDLPSAEYGPGITYDVVTLLDSPASGGTLSFGTYQDALSEADVAAMTLHIGERSFDLADATHAYHTITEINSYTWSLSPRFGWAENETVAVSITALPLVSISGVTQVQYKEIAEFTFTRTGSTDEALSFIPLFIGRAENPQRARSRPGSRASATTTGPLTWTTSNNPVCEITWHQYLWGCRAGTATSFIPVRLLTPYQSDRTGHDLHGRRVAPAPLQPLAGEGRGMGGG